MAEIDDAIMELADAGIPLRDPAPLAGGLSGNAFEAFGEDGAKVIVKLGDNDWKVSLAQAEMAEILRSRGYPLPARWQPVNTGKRVAILQSVLPGAAVNSLEHSFVDQLLGLNDLQAGAAGTGLAPFKETLVESLVDGLAGYCEHEYLQQYNDDARALLGWLLDVGRDAASVDVPNADAVHYDFHHFNLLRSPDDRVTGVVDWEDSKSGDRAFDIVTLLIDAAGPELAPSVSGRLHEYLAQQVSVDRLRLYVAHMVLRVVEWNLRIAKFDRADFQIRQADHWRQWVETL